MMTLHSSLAALTLLTGCGSMLTSVQAGDATAVQGYLLKGGDPNETNNGVTLLCTAMESGHLAVAEVLLDRGANVQSGCWSETPLCRAIGKQKAQFASLFMARGAEVNASCGFTNPLGLALANGDTKTAELLLAKGADPRATTRDGSMLSHAIRDTSGASARFFFGYLDAKLGEIETRTLVDPGYLEFAVRSGNVIAVTELLAHGADPNGFTAVKVGSFSDEIPYLFYAKLGGNTPLEQALLAAHADSFRTSRGGKSYAEVASVIASETELLAEAQRQLDIANREEAARVAQMQREEAREDAENQQRMVSAFSAGLQSGFQQANQYAPANTPSSGGGSGYAAPSSGAAKLSEPSPASPATGTPTRGAGAGAAENQNADRERRLADEKAERERREADAKAATKQRVQDKLSSLSSSIQLSATKCTGGDGAYYVKGSRPGPLGPDLHCISVSYRASCPDNVGVSEGRIGNYVGASCAGIGDSPRIQPALKCPVERVTVQVTDVQPCSN